MEIKQFFVSRDVKFHETVFPFANIQVPPTQKLVLPDLSFDIIDNIPSKQFSTTNVPTSEPPEQPIHAHSTPELFPMTSSTKPTRQLHKPSKTL